MKHPPLNPDDFTPQQIAAMKAHAKAHSVAFLRGAVQRVREVEQGIAARTGVEVSEYGRGFREGVRSALDVIEAAIETAANEMDGAAGGATTS